MSKQLVSGKHRLRNTYWSLVGAASATILSVQPVMAETIWDRFSTIMRDIYGQLVGISTIVAVTVAAPLRCWCGWSAGTSVRWTRLPAGSNESL